MNSLNKNKTGLTTGVIFGVFHLAWVGLVASGVAQPIMDWIFKLHFIQPLYIITSFDFIKALTLIAVTFSVGFILGWMFAAVWNKAQTCCTQKSTP